MPPSTSGTIISDDNTLQDKIDHADMMMYIVIALGCLVGLMIIIFIVCKVKAYKTEKKEKERRKQRMARSKQSKSLNGSKRNSPRRGTIHPRIEEIKKDEMMFTRSDSGYTSDSKKDISPGTSRDNTPRRPRKSREIPEPQSEAAEILPLQTLSNPSTQPRKVDGLAF